MNRLFGSILLQHQDAWSLRVRGVVLDHSSSAQSVNDIAHLYPVCGELLVAVDGYTHFAARHERAYLFQSLAQFLDPFVAGVCSDPLTVHGVDRNGSLAGYKPRVHLSDYCHVATVQEDSTPEMAFAVATFTRERVDTRGPRA